jgi:predicted RNase H-like HicB family nuclease
MFYPLFVHRDEESAYGGTIPDIPGCFTAADNLADLPRMAQEAVSVFFEGEDLDVPPPSEVVRRAKDEKYQGGFWMVVEIDLAQVNAKPTRPNISLPAYLVQRIDRHVEARHTTRSGFLARAAIESLSSE